MTHLYLTAYFENVVKYGQVKANDDGTFTFGYAAPDDTVVPGVPVSQTGEWVVEALSNPDKWLRASSGRALRDELTGQERIFTP